MAQASRIQNAEIRYQNRLADSGIASTVDRKIQKQKVERDAANDAEYESISEEEAENLAYFENEALLSRSAKKKYKKGEDELLDELKLLSRNDQQTITLQKATAPTFPVFIVTAAVFKDLLDIPANLTLIASIATSILGFFMSVIIFFWILGKINGKWWKKRLIRWLWKRYILVVLIEIIPGLQLIPMTTIFVLMAHYREKKIVILANKALEVLRGNLRSADL